MSPRGRLTAWLIVIVTSACNVPVETFRGRDASIGIGAEITDARPPGVLEEDTYIKAFNTNANDLFGLSVALSADGTTLAVGARGESSAVTGVNGNPQDNSAANAGAVYVFTRTGNAWTQQAYLKASNTGAGDLFGSSVALSADGALLAVGAPFEQSAAAGINSTNAADNSLTNAGAAYVFARTGSTWGQQAYVKASNTSAGALFGGGVALSTDGTTLAVGARAEATTGAVYVFTRAAAAWSQQAYLKAAVTGSGDNFGGSVSLTGDGSTLAVGALFEDSCSTDPNDNSCANAGAAYVFTRSGAAWTQQAYIKSTNVEASDSFASSVRISADGSTLAVGAFEESSKSTGINGNELDRYATASGAVYIFTPVGASWTQQAFIKASNAATNDFFAFSLSLSADGSTLAVGASEEDSAATGIQGDQTDNNAVNSGAVYTFSRTGTTWRQSLYAKASNTQAGADFANVALSADGSTMAVGADGESSAATVVNGIQADQSAANAGAVYIFR
jgi:hypothetical protein